MSRLQRQPAQITKKESKRKGRGFRRVLTDRNHLVIGVFELFFRKNMGIRYFDRGTLTAILIGLAGVKILLNYRSMFAWISSTIIGVAIDAPDGGPYYPFCGLDVFILLCIGLGIYHLREQQQLRGEGRRINTDYMGTSRFGALGRYFNKEYPQFGAYLYVEPPVAFIVSFMTLEHSLILGVMGMIGACRLWYENYLVVREYKDMVYDMEDANVLSSHLEHKREQDEEAVKVAKQRAKMPPPMPKKAAPVMPPPIPLVSNPEEEVSALDAIRQIKQEQKGDN